MNELYFPEAVVLDREDSNEVDSRFSIYAKGYGKFFAKAKSARKILSKLSGHLEPGSLVKIRLVGNGGLQVVDALKFGKVTVGAPDLYLLNRLLPEEDFDFQVWEQIINVRDVRVDRGGGDGEGVRDDGSNRIDGMMGQVSQNFDWRRILRILGWDPEHANCQICGGKPVFFVLKNQSFVCDRCVLKANGELIQCF